MISLAEYLNTALPQPNDWQTLLARGWTTAVGELAKHMRLEQIRGNLLIVGVYDSHWISELFMLAPRIMQEINGFLGGPYIAQIRFVIANQKDKKATGRSRKNTHDSGKTLNSPISMTARQEQVLASVKDVQLHDALKKFFYAAVHQKSS